MATQVLAPSTTSILHAEGPEYYTSNMSSQNQRQPRVLDMPRSHFNPSAAPAGYRGAAAAPVSSYAFKTAPQLRTDTRSVSSPAMSAAQPAANGSSRNRYPANPSVSTTSSTSSDPSSISQHHLFNKEDALLFTNFSVPPFSTDSEARKVSDVQIANADVYSNTTALPVKPSPPPERYRRTLSRTGSEGPIVRSKPSEDSIRTVGTATTGHIYQKPQIVSTGTSRNEDDERQASAADIRQISNGKQSPTSELPKRYRRRTEGSPVEAASAARPSTVGPSPQTQDARPSSPSGYRPTSSGSTARSFSTADAVRRVNNPSPLSRPATSQTERPFSSSSSTMGTSPAAAAMAAIHEKESGKTVKSRLRRAFSFGSSAEMKRAGGVSQQESAAERARARQQQFSSEISNDLDEEQAAIARKQEKAGLGQGIYGNRGGRFTGSTDNLSISSTASSASLMLRKMGNGMKKSGKSIKGLFRPKSVIGVPSADESMQASIGPISRVTVEAEREQVNVNADPHDHAGGGTGYPKLERNSVETLTRTALPQMPSRQENVPVDFVPQGYAQDARPVDSELGQFRSASAPPLKKGILKRSYTASPMGSPSFLPSDGAADPRPSIFTGLRSASPAPSNASSSSRRHRRTDSSTVDVDDYFGGSSPNAVGNQSYRSLPGTPRERLRRNISFSPRIQFHDVYSSSDYDRRGDIATCNRLTPLLAQQIKEELNTFKMEMEVHDASKVHTHFF